MTKQTSFEAAVANHVRTQIEIGAEKLGGMHEVVNNCILVMNEDYSSNDAIVGEFANDYQVLQ